ncbi:MAG: hypothetical protein NT013_12845 [Planctomycetia bacterium]|nr:hypothetical protein [Planctomycetia bacterium]
MDGFLDELNQAWLNLDFGEGRTDFLIDTGFAGTLIIGEELFDTSRAIPAGFVDSTLAAGQSFRYERFDLSFEWLGVSVRLFVLVGPGTEYLIGTDLLSPHRLEIDYQRQIVQLHRSPEW